MNPSPYRVATSPPKPDVASPEDRFAKLGSLRSEHPRLKPVLWDYILPPLPILVLSLITFAGIVLGDKGWAAVAVGGLFGLLTLRITLHAAIPFRHRGMRIDVHAHGLAIKSAKTTTVVLFDDVDQVWFEFALVWRWFRYPEPLRLRLVEHSGARHIVPLHAERADRIVQWVTSECSETLSGGAADTIKTGGTLSFGDVHLDAHGITIGGAHATWHEISCVSFDSDRMNLFRHGKLVWRVVMFDEAPHPTLLASLVRKEASRAAIVERTRSKTARLRY